VGGAVLATHAEQGQTVRKGQLLVRLDDVGLREQVLSARSGVATATATASSAERDYERNQTLLEAGAVAERVVEQARTALTAARAQLANARAILANAEEQSGKTAIVAPFTGVVSVRSVSGGDVVTPGTALFTIVSPASMRLEANVPAEALSQVHVGVGVDFTVSGYKGRSFTGKVTRISPVADPTTRQVQVIVTIPNDAGILVGGLFASGQVASQTATAPVVPEAAVDEGDAQPFVMRVHHGRAVKTPVELGIRDVPSETVSIVSGLQPGDTVLIGAAREVSEGTPVRVGPPRATN
jgi:RND family efflux transporter MFP subunit